MKILFFARRFYPDIGGVETHVMEVGKRLVAMGHEVTVVSEEISSRQVKSPKSSRVNGIISKKIPVGRHEKQKKFVIWQWLRKHKQLIEDVDVVHCHDVFYWYFPFRFMYPKKPVYTTFHGYEGYPISKKAIAVRKLSEKLSWGNICIGDFIPKWYGTKPTFVSYGAVDLEKNKEKRVVSKKKSAIFFGRLDEQTGILTYMKAIELLRKKYPQFGFTIIGEGKYKRKIEKKVKLLGFQKNPGKYLQDYRFVFVSRYLSILEAMASRRLVIATYDTQIKEDYLKLAPFSHMIIIANNAEHIAKIVEFLLHNPRKEKELINNAYEWAKKQSWEKVIDMYVTLWKSGLDK